MTSVSLLLRVFTNAMSIVVSKHSIDASPSSSSLSVQIADASRPDPNQKFWQWLVANNDAVKGRKKKRDEKADEDEQEDDVSAVPRPLLLSPSPSFIDMKEVLGGDDSSSADDAPRSPPIGSRSTKRSRVVSRDESFEALTMSRHGVSAEQEFEQDVFAVKTAVETLQRKYKDHYRQQITADKLAETELLKVVISAWFDNRYSVPSGGSKSEPVKRGDLLVDMNLYLQGFGFARVTKKDPLWCEWFLGECVGLSADERLTGKHISLEPKKSIATTEKALQEALEKLQRRKSSL